MLIGRVATRYLEDKIIKSDARGALRGADRGERDPTVSGPQGSGELLQQCHTKGGWES